MPCGLHPVDCISEHLCPPLNGRSTRTRGGRPIQWSARCPVCGGHNRRLSLAIRNGRIVWNCHKDPPCHPDEIRDALAALSPSCLSPGRHRRIVTEPIDRDALIALAMRDLPATALRVGLLRLAGFSAGKARAELGLAKSTYYDALRNLGQ